MRRLIIYILVCVALCACSESNSEVDSTQQKVLFNIEVSAPDTRTALVNEDGKYKAIWKEGDFYIVAQIAEKESSFCTGTVEADTPSIKVVAEFEQTEGSSYRYLFASPNLAVSADCTTLGFPLPSRQSPQGMDTFDGAADVILSDVIEFANQPSDQTVTFNTKRVSAVGKVTVKNVALAEGDAVRSIIFACEHPLAGDVTNVVVEDIVAGNDPLTNSIIESASNTITVMLHEPQTGEFTYFFSCLPATLAAGESYIVTLNTEQNHSFVKQAKIPSDLSFTSGRMTTFTVNMAGIVADAPAVDSANCQILYTSTDGNVVTPYATDVFGATIVSNTYENGQGVIAFDGEVTKIGGSAFRGCTNLKTLNIPNSVTSIERWAFLDCDSLEEFFGSNIISNGRAVVVNGTMIAFAQGGLTSYVLPSEVTAVDVSVFESCDKLIEISLGENIITIGGSAFDSCIGITSITIPQSVTAIGNHAFHSCTKLGTVYVESATPPTGEVGMFDNNAANRKIYVPSGSVDAYKAAEGWSEYADAIVAEEVPANYKILYTSTDGNVVTPNATDVFGANIVSNTYENGQGVITFDSAVTSVGNYAFYKCRNLTSVTIPNGVTLIGNNAFDECSISSIIIPDGVESIGTDAFIYCHNLTEVHIPQNVITLGGNPFRSCNGLAKFSGKYASADGRLLVQNGNIYSFAQAGLVEYTITEPGVNTIGWELFRDCESLVEVTIPQTITKIDFEAFYNCSSLKSVYCRSTTPPILGSKAFGGNATDRKIYVPASSVEAYKSAQYWKEYADAIVAEGGDGILPTFESNEIVGHNVPFAVGDLFYVFNKINHCDEYKYNGNTNEEGKPIIELSNPTYYSSHKTIDKVIIVYNSDKSLSLPVNEGSATSVNVVVKSVQDYVRGSYDIHAAPMISVSDDLGSVLLKNVCGWVKVSLTGNGETVKKIEFSGNNNEELATSSMISSSATISLSDLSVTSVGYAFTKLTMDFDNADEDENWDTATLSTTPTDFYFSMLPTEFTNGFNMKITCTDGTMMTYTTNNSISVSRNEVYQETPFTYAGEPIQLNISDLNSPVFRDLTYSEGYANTFEVKAANNKYQNGFFIFYNPDYQPSGAGDAGTLNGEYEIVTDEIGTKTYTAKTFIADPSRSCVPYDGDLYYFKSGKVTVSGNNASTTIAFDAIVTNSEGGELPLKSQCTLESMGYTTLTNAENLGFSSFVYQASGGYFTMQSTSGQNTMTIELKTTAKTPNELKDKTFTDTALNDYISSGSLRMGDLTSYDTLVGSIIFAVEGLNYTMTTKGLKFIDYTGNIYQIPDGGYSVSLKQGTINSGGGIW